jgi:hypothetical protein
MGESNPKYADGDRASGMLSSVSFGGQGSDPKVQFGNTTFMAGSRMEFNRELRAGQPIKHRRRQRVYGKPAVQVLMPVVRRTGSSTARAATCLARWSSPPCTARRTAQ